MKQRMIRLACRSVILSLVAAGSLLGGFGGKTTALAEETLPSNRLGALFAMDPSYPGAKSFRLTARPDIDVTFEKRLFLNTDNGLGIYLLNEGGFTFGPSVFTRLGRYRSASAALDGLDTVKTAPQARVSAGYDFGLWDINAAVAHDAGGGSGTTFEVKAGTAFPIAEKLYLAPTANVTFGDRNYMSAWYGVSVPESTRSRYRAYAPRGGLESVGGTLSLFYVIDRKWAPFVKAETHYLLGPAGSSPITASRWQQSIGAGLSYLFD